MQPTHSDSDMNIGVNPAPLLATTIMTTACSTAKIAAVVAGRVAARKNRSCLKRRRSRAGSTRNIAMQPTHSDSDMNIGVNPAPLLATGSRRSASTAATWEPVRAMVAWSAVE